MKIPKKQTRSYANDTALGLQVWGVRASSGKHYIKVKYRGAEAFIPHADFMTPQKVTEHLIVNNVVLIGGDRSKLTELVKEITRFRERSLCEQPGWNGIDYALPDATVLSASDEREPLALFPPRGGVSRGGKGTKWRDEVAALLANQTLPAFILMAGFASPLLTLVDRSENFGFELAGPPRTGKSTLLLVLASMVGQAFPSHSDPGVFWRKLNATVAGLETMMPLYQDLPFILDEAGHFEADAPALRRAAAWLKLILQLASGDPKARHESVPDNHFRFIYFVSTNEPIAETIAGGNHAREQAGLDRLITLPVPDVGEGRGNGIFDYVPQGYSSGADFIRAIEDGIKTHYGHAFPRFIRFLVDERAKDEPRLRRKLRRLSEEFRTAASVATDGDLNTRVCDIFGLVYAAGTLAVEYEVLPETYDCLDIALKAYRRHLDCRDERTPAQKLLDLADSNNVIRVERGGNDDLTWSEVQKSHGLLHDGRKGDELLLTSDQLQRLFPSITTKNLGEDLEWLIEKDGDHKRPKRLFNPNERRKRFYCFPLARLRNVHG